MSKENQTKTSTCNVGGGKRVLNLLLKRLCAFPTLFLLFFIINVYDFIHKNFGGITLEQLLFFITYPHEGADTGLTGKFIQECVFQPVTGSLIICFLPDFYKLFTICKPSYTGTITVLSIVAIIVFCHETFNFNNLISIFHRETSSFYEQHFVMPSADNVKFTQKKNILVIMVESLEKSFADSKTYGHSMIPDLERLEKNGIRFNSYLNGFATDFTEGAIIAEFGGVPPSFIENNVLFNNKLLHIIVPIKNMYSLGKILKDNGYSNTFVFGSSGKFAGQRLFLQNHGIQKIIDKEYIDEKILDTHYHKNNWGYDDKAVLNVLKEVIISQPQNQPWFIQAETIDTHTENISDVGEFNKFNNKYKNMIYNTNLLVADFLKWFQQRPEYKNTVVILIGDHLRMGNNIEYPAERQIYNLFLNSPKPQNLNRKFTQIDLFPTILEAAGATVKGHRLGLGTSIFSNESTLAERYSENYLQTELRKKNKLCESLWK